MLLILIAFVGVALLALLVVVRRRSLSGLENGFLLTLALTLAGTGSLSAVLVGFWTADNAEQALLRGSMDDLDADARLVEASAKRDIAITMNQMSRIAQGIASHLPPREFKEIGRDLATLQRVDRTFLDLQVVDPQGTVLVSSGQSADAPLSRIAVAFALEGEQFVSEGVMREGSSQPTFFLAVPIQGGQGKPIAVLIARFDLLYWYQDLLKTLTFGETGYAVLIDHDGRVLAHPDAKVTGTDLSSSTAFRQARNGRTGWIAEADQAGVRKLMAYRPVKNPATVNAKPWIAIAQMDEQEALAPARAFRYQAIAIAVVVVLVSLAVAYQVSLYLKRPLNGLLDFVQRVRGGDLTARAQPQGRDEIARLEGALNDMVLGLQERDRVKEIFGRYMTTKVSEEVLKGAIKLGGEQRRVTMLFCDIRNFTTMSESMSPAQVVDFLNGYFSDMVDAVFEHGGVLDKFMGDALLCVFGSIEEMPDHPRRAVMVGLRMKALLAKINGERNMAGKTPIDIGIGIHTDDVIVGNIGSRRRLEYTVIGDGVNTCQRVENANKDFGTTLLITETTYEAVQSEFECRPMQEAPLKGKTKIPRLWEVVSFRATSAT